VAAASLSNVTRSQKQTGYSEFYTSSSVAVDVGTIAGAMHANAAHAMTAKGMGQTAMLNRRNGRRWS
jgi:hypothetical protein